MSLIILLAEYEERGVLTAVWSGAIVLLIDIFFVLLASSFLLLDLSIEIDFLGFIGEYIADSVCIQVMDA